MKKMVLDTSVIIKWVTAKEEENIDKANLILEEIQSGKVEIVTSELIYYEIGNAFYWSKKLRNQKFLRAFERLLQIPLTIYPFENTSLPQIYSIMNKNKISFYDTVFAAIALSENCPLVSADEKHHGGLPNVTLLKNYSASD